MPWFIALLLRDGARCCIVLQLWFITLLLHIGAGRRVVG